VLVVTAARLAKITDNHQGFPFPMITWKNRFRACFHRWMRSANQSRDSSARSIGEPENRYCFARHQRGVWSSLWPSESFAGCASEIDLWNRFFALNFRFNEQTIRNIFQPPWDQAVLSTAEDLRNEYAADMPINGEAPEVDLDWIYLLRRIPLFIIWGPYIWNSAFQVAMPPADVDYLKAVVALPPWQRLGNRYTSVIKSGNPRFLKIPLVPSGRTLQPRIGERWRVHWRLKTASLLGISQRSPQKYDLWLRQEAAFVESVLFSNHAVDRKVFRIEGVRKFWRDHMRRQWTSLLCNC
jgi:hypothetical protein